MVGAETEIAEHDLVVRIDDADFDLLPVVDLIFGTLYLPRRMPEKYGISDEMAARLKIGFAANTEPSVIRALMEGPGAFTKRELAATSAFRPTAQDGLVLDDPGVVRGVRRSRGARLQFEQLVAPADEVCQALPLGLVRVTPPSPAARNTAHS